MGIHHSPQSLLHFTEVETEAPAGPQFLRNGCQGLSQGPTPSDLCSLFADTKPANSLIPFLSLRSSEVRTLHGAGWEESWGDEAQGP